MQVALFPQSCTYSSNVRQGPDDLLWQRFWHIQLTQMPSFS